MSHIGWSACEPAIAFEIKENALEKMLEVEQAITAPLEHLEFVVQPFNKAAIVSVNEIVEDFLPPAFQGVEERVKTGIVPSPAKIGRSRSRLALSARRAGWPRL